MSADDILGVDLHDAMLQLQSAIRAKKLLIRSTDTIRSLSELRFGPDGRIDASTVDGHVRAIARAFIAAEQTRQMEAQKAKTKGQRIDDLF